MSTSRPITALAFVLALATAIAIAAPAQRSSTPPSRVNDRQVEQLLERLEKTASQFRDSLSKALDRSRISGSREQDAIEQSVTEFAEATEHLRDHFNRRQVVTRDVEDTLRRAVGIDNFMQQRERLAVRAESDWLRVRNGLDDLARAFNVVWDWSSPRSSLGDSGTGAYQRLTGTYQLERTRSDDPREAAEHASRTVPASRRERTYRSLVNRLEAPELIAIDRNGTAVTIASSNGPRLTFEADDRVRAEQGPAGRTFNTRATLHGDQLVIATTGNQGNDFTVTFEPIDNGSSLRVTRRLYHDDLRRPLTAHSLYRKSSDDVEWDVYTNARARSTTSLTGNHGVPDGTRFVVTLDRALSTKTSNEGDRFTMTTRSPLQYDGAVVEGVVSNLNTSGRVSGRAEMTLGIESIRLRGGRVYPFAAVIESVRTDEGETFMVNSGGEVEDRDNQTAKTVQRGAIGAAIGAIIGAVAGGGQGAAIGAVVGAGGGAGTVFLEGRDQFEMKPGTELTITARER